MLSVEGVYKQYQGRETLALIGINLGIGANEFFTLLGPSGCGKTTLLRILAGFEHPTSGRVLLEGQEIGHVPPHRRPLNTMFQNYALFPHLTVGKNIEFGLRMLKWEAAAIRTRVAEMLDLVQLGGAAGRSPSELSGGQQQRVALARALAPRPRALLLDEPLSALDMKLRRGMQIELKRLQRETGVAFVMVTHDQEEALALSDRIAVMNKGEVLQVGRPHDIYENPETRFVADFIGEANLLPGGMIGVDGDLIVAVRPERLLLSQAPSPGHRSLRCTLSSVTYLGSDTLAEGRLENGMLIRSRMRGPLVGLAPGDAMIAHWNGADERRLAP